MTDIISAVAPDLLSHSGADRSEVSNAIETAECEDVVHLMDSVLLGYVYVDQTVVDDETSFVDCIVGQLSNYSD